MNSDSGHGHEYKIFVNGREAIINSDVVTYAQVVALAPNLPPPGDGVEYQVTYSDAGDPKAGDLIPGESVRIKNGTQFVVEPGNRS